MTDVQGNPIKRRTDEHNIAVSRTFGSSGAGGLGAGVGGVGEADMAVEVGGLLSAGKFDGRRTGGGATGGGGPRGGTNGGAPAA